MDHMQLKVWPNLAPTLARLCYLHNICSISCYRFLFTHTATCMAALILCLHATSNLYIPSIHSRQYTSNNVASIVLFYQCRHLSTYVLVSVHVVYSANILLQYTNCCLSVWTLFVIKSIAPTVQMSAESALSACIATMYVCQDSMFIV